MKIKMFAQAIGEEYEDRINGIGHGNVTTLFSAEFVDDAMKAGEPFNYVNYVPVLVEESRCRFFKTKFADSSPWNGKEYTYALIDGGIPAENVLE